MICLKCGGKLKEFGSANEGRYFVLKLRCENKKCRAIFSVPGKSYRDSMGKLSSLRRKMRRQEIRSRHEKTD
jgi:hypothetical protein